jgi:hypothetical protein
MIEVNVKVEELFDKVVGLRRVPNVFNMSNTE